MFYNNTKTMAAVGGVLLLISISACVFFFYIVREQKLTLQDKVSVQAAAEAHQESLIKMMTMLEETKLDRKSLDSRVLDADGVINFLALLETLGKEQGVTLVTSSLNTEQINDTFERLIVNIRASGSYEGVIHILKLLEQVPYQSELRATNISRTSVEQRDSWEGVFELSVTKFKKHEN